MALLDIQQTTTSDLKNKLDDFEVDTAALDSSPGTQQEFEWTNPNWAQYLGYYFEIPELRSAIDAKATWTVGKGFKADEITTMLLDNIKGFGKDTFNTIIENILRQMMIGGDGFAEIIRDEQGILINLKPLDPGSVKIVVNKQGIIERYEQITKIPGNNKVKKFAPDEIFHLARNRLGDEVHGRSIIQAVEKIILYRNEAMEDWRENMHRNVHPLRLWKLDTDITSKRDAFRDEVHDAFKKKGEHLFIPKDVVEHEIATIPGNATLNAQPWIADLNNNFFESVGMPKIIVGGTGGVTEAAVKIAYLAWQQNIEEEQLFLEEQILSQLNLVVEFDFPARLENELLSDNRKDGPNSFNQNDTTAEIEGRK